MKVLIIVGSARKKGHSLEIANNLAKRIESTDNASAKILNLSEKKIGFCFGCVKCCENENQYCILKDDIHQAYSLLEESDNIVFISPIYESFISGILKNFFDRTNHYTSFFKLAGKPISLILNGVQPLKGKTKEFSNKHVVKNINNYFNNYSIITHTHYHFLGFIQHQDHHSIKFEADERQIEKIVDKILKLKKNEKLVKKSKYTYSV